MAGKISARAGEFRGCLPNCEIQYLSFPYNPCPVVTFLACEMQGHFGPLLMSNLSQMTAVLHLQFPCGELGNVHTAADQARPDQTIPYHTTPYKTAHSHCGRPYHTIPSLSRE